MSKARHTHIQFDFFGPPVDYSASRTDQGYPRSHTRRADSVLDLRGFCRIPFVDSPAW
jgi:putative hydrolase of the HAD superfamily